MLNKFDVECIVLATLKEDIGPGDITTDNLIDVNAISRAVYIAREDGVIAGLDLSEAAFKLLDKNTRFKRDVVDGSRVTSGNIIAEIEGNTRAMLMAERTSLNFLQRLSGIATKTRLFADKVKDLPVRVTDTRKTTPGMRLFEKYAVKVGGGCNHRFNLADGVLIKDNHIKAAGSIKKAVQLVREGIPHTIKIEVETESLEQVREALESKADIIMLDNMGLGMMREAVKMINKQAIVEASGNVNLERLYDIAMTGVDIISVGGLTHSINSMDISMRIV